MADVLNQKCLRLSGLETQQLRQRTSIWISCKHLPKGYRGEGKELRGSLRTLLADGQTAPGEWRGPCLHFLIGLIHCEWSRYGTKMLLVDGVQYYQGQCPLTFNVFSTSSFFLYHMGSKRNVRLRILCCGDVTYLRFGHSFEVELPSRPSLAVSSPEKSGRL